MTLKEKYIKLFPHQYEDYLDDEEAEKCEQIAEDFAIDFAEWCLNYFPEKIVTSKQLLEIFKKEKGL